jgi:ATP-dependent Zn protease
MGPMSHGYHRSLPEESLLTRADVDRVLRRIMGGLAAERLLLGEPSSGAGGPPDSDLAKATGFAAKAIACWGLGTTQHLLWRGEPTPENLRRIVAEQPDIAAEVHGMLAAAHDGALAILTEHRDGLVRVARALLENGILERSEVTSLLTPSDPDERPVAREDIPR